MAIRKRAQSTPRRKIKYTKNEVLAQAAVNLAKRAVPPSPYIAWTELNAKVPAQQFSMIARVYEGNDSFLARVPFRVTTVPELTEVIIIDDKVYVLRSTYPLTYLNVPSARALRIK